MYIGEIPKNEKILLSFDLTGNHYTVSTSVIGYGKPPLTTLHTTTIKMEDDLRYLNGLCKNLEITYLSTETGRTHIWNQAVLRYIIGAGEHFEIRCEKASSPLNRRRAIRIGVGARSDCNISLIDGKYPCIVNDISVTGIGIEIDARLAEKDLAHRTIFTHFRDGMLNKEFTIIAECLHTTKVNDRIVRCGCELVSVTPSINDYIKTRQLYWLARTPQPSLSDEEKKRMESELVSATAIVMPEESGMIISEGMRCPLCNEGMLVYNENYYECPKCGSMLEF